MKKKSKKTIIGIIIAILAILIFFMPVITSAIMSYKPPMNKFVKKQTLEVYEDFFYRTEITRLPASFRVTNNLTKIGIAVEPSKLEFGVLPPNISAKKIIDISNRKETPVKVKIKSYGNISKLLTLNTRNEFVLGGKQNKTVIIKAKGDRVGAYEGEVEIIIKRAKNTWGEWLLVFA